SAGEGRALQAAPMADSIAYNLGTPMQALLLAKYRQLEMADLPTPELGHDDVLVKVAACGICGSDVHGYAGASGRRIPPIVMGHEAAGIISGIGSGVTGWSLGE